MKLMNINTRRRDESHLYQLLTLTKDTRKAVFDIFCENEKGEKFIVEMQKARQNFFKDRALFYSSSAIMQQGQADWNYELKERIFKKMFAAAEIANLTKEDYWRYLDNFTAENDLNNVLDTAIGDGLAKGFARGLKKGKAEGRAEEREKIVINSYQAGLSEEMIINISGLKIEDIRAILEKKLILTP